MTYYLRIARPEATPGDYITFAVLLILFTAGALVLYDLFFGRKR